MAETLQEYLVRLQFEVDRAQHSRFQDAMKESRLNISGFNKELIGVIDRFANLATIAAGAGVGIVASLNNVGRAIAGVAFSADRIGTSPDRLIAFERAMEMLGGTAAGARQTLESLATVQRENPGILQSLFGVKPGTDPVEAMRLLGTHFAELISRGEMGMAQAVREAAIVHLSQEEMLRLANQNFGRFYDESRTRLRGWVSNLEQVGKVAEAQQQQVVRLQSHWQGFTTFLYERFAPAYVEALGGINKWLDDNQSKVKTHVTVIEGEFDRLTKGIKGAFEGLSPGQQTAVEVGGAAIGTVVAARAAGSIGAKLGGLVGLPGLGKLGSLGIFTAVLGGLLADYETWKQNRDEAFIDWGKWEPGIKAATDMLSKFNDDVVGPLADKLGVPRTFLPAFEALAAYLGGRAFISTILGGGLGNLLKALALIPGSGVTAAMLTSLGIASGVALGLTAGQGHMATAEEEERSKNAALDFGKGGEKMTDVEASRRVQEDTSRARAGGGGMLGRMMGALGLGGKIDPGQAHTAEEIKQYMMGMGWPEHVAAGIAANAIAESGGRPRIINESGHAGLFQWDQNRQQMFARMTGHTMTDQRISDEQLFREELDFANWELHNTEAIAGKRISQTTTAGDAAIAFGQGFERYASGPSPEDQRRANIATQISGGGGGKLNIPPAAIPGLGADSPLAHPAGSADPAGTGAHPAGVAAPVDLGLADSPLARPAGFAAPIDLAPSSAPAVPGPAEAAAMSTTNNNRNVQVSDNSTINVTGVSDPERAASLVDRNRQRINANVVRHLGVAYA